MERQYLTAQEVADIIGISKTKAYSLIRTMNAELAEAGYITISGKVPVAFFNKKCYGCEAVKE